MEAVNRVVLVRQGAKYAPEYVSALTRQIQEHGAYEVVTLTDQSDTPGETRPLRHNLPGWWSKLELFAIEDLRPCLFIDLDSFVFGPLDELMGGHSFKMVRDFNRSAHANSSVMWVPEQTPPIWEQFSAAPNRHMQEAGARGDQWFLDKFCEAMWEPVESGIVSYKRHGREGPAGTVMQFHGRPKMPDIKGGWVRDRWSTYSS